MGGRERKGRTGQGKKEEKKKGMEKIKELKNRNQRENKWTN
jgi:hypothetical protein